MALIHPGDPLMRDPDWRPEDLTCFLCGNTTIAEPSFIHWAGFAMGGTKHLILHGDCATLLASYLRKDALSG